MKLKTLVGQFKEMWIAGQGHAVFTMPWLVLIAAFAIVLIPSAAHMFVHGRPNIIICFLGMTTQLSFLPITIVSVLGFWSSCASRWRGRRSKFPAGLAALFVLSNGTMLLLMLGELYGIGNQAMDFETRGMLIPMSGLVLLDLAWLIMAILANRKNSMTKTP